MCDLQSIELIYDKGILIYLQDAFLLFDLWFCSLLSNNPLVVLVVPALCYSRAVSIHERSRVVRTTYERR